MALYDSIGCTYDVTRTADPFIVSRLLHHLKPSPTRLYLDVGCGSGNYTSALAKAGVNLIGADASTEMLTKARSKLPHRLLQTDAHHLSFADDTFDGAISTFVHHHFRDPQSAFWEVGRVLKRTSRFVILNATAEQTRRYWLNEYFPESTRKSVAMYERFDAREGLERAGFEIVGLEPYEVQLDLKDLFYYSGKHRPELYLDPAVRAGISCFMLNAAPEEIELGCKRLEADIKSGRIREVIASYQHDGGDYMFHVAVKR